MIKKGLKAKYEGLKQGKFTHGWYDWLVFKKTKAVLGGRVRGIVTGSAPIKSDILEFLKICFACNILEGYGQTENAAVATVTREEDPSAGHVGGPVGAIELKLVDLPEMNYTSRDVDENGNNCPRGEICLRGTAVTPGYFKLPEKTAEAIDEQGWLHTGDVG
mmetsp:Transcript_18538/g.3021  ORF Transcript_18538/g.3021 Transcript_18538/m.3021 type:complete len:162 (+) Transcript_18538:1050-1535(+)